jgi:Xaa-Pro aminopeptidase
MAAPSQSAGAMDYRARQRRLAEVIAAKRLDALVVTHLPNVRYLCGFTGSNALLLAGIARPILFTDGRYTEQARLEARNARVVISKGALLADVAKHIARFNLADIGFEAEHISAATRSEFRRRLSSRASLRHSVGMVEELRIIKDAGEIAAIRHAVMTAAALFEPLLPSIRPGKPETTIAGEMEFAARRAGAEGMSFETIVASGERSALPHGRASAAALPERGFVILDYGVRIGGYCSDMTRTVHLGTPASRAHSMYEAVCEAQQAAVTAVRAGVAAGEVDDAARGVLQRAGFGRYFTHSTGHGVGLEIHEAPRIAHGQTLNLQAGMIITIEPGIYIPGVGGVRIEDMVCVTETGCEILTPTTKELITL